MRGSLLQFEQICQMVNEPCVLKFVELIQQYCFLIMTGWSFGNTKKGWMTQECFLSYLKTHFYPSVCKISGMKFPVLLIVDGVSSHISYDVAGNYSLLLGFLQIINIFFKSFARKIKSFYILCLPTLRTFFSLRTFLYLGL